MLNLTSPIDAEHKYQQTMIDFAMDVMFTKGQKGAGLLADPGLGKTRCALSIADLLLSLGEAHRVLIVGPLRPLDMVWPAERIKWGFTQYKMARLDPMPPRMMGQNAQIEMISRDSLHKITSFAGRWDFLIVDEGHGFKAWSTDRMSNLRKILPRTPRRLLLTGTPTPNTLADLHSQAFICDDGLVLGKNVTVFRRKYMYQGGWQGRQWFFKKEMTDELLAAVAPFMIRMDAESNLDMPDLFINDIWINLPPEAQGIHAEMKRELAATLESGEVFAPNAAAAFNKLRQIANGSIYNKEKIAHHVHSEKLNALVDLVDELSGKQMLVFYQFKFDAVVIQSRLKNSIVVDGGLSAKQAMANIEKWLAGKVQLLLIQNQAGAEGLNLQTGGCADVSFFGIPTIANLYTQGYYRIYRQGGARSIRVHRFLGADTVDVIQVQRLDGKLEIQSAFLRALKAFANS